MSIAMVVQDAVRTAAVCVIRHPAARLSKAEWIVGGVRLSLNHAKRVRFSGADSHAFRCHVLEYVGALQACGEELAARLVEAEFNPTAGTQP